MAIPGSGKVSIGDLRIELANESTNNFQLSKAGRPTTGVPGTFQPPVYVPINQSSTSKPDNTSPFQISEWRGYNHSENLPCAANFTTPSLGSFYTYYRVQITGQPSYQSTIAVTGNSTSNHACFIYITYPFNNLGQINVSAWTYSLFTSATTKYFTKTMLSTSETLYFVFYLDMN